MGYLTDSTPSTKNWVICQDIYPFRVIINPGFASDLTLQMLVKSEIADVQEWQFSGRRRCARPRRGVSINPLVHPYGYAVNSRRVRPFDARVVFAFHTTTQRDTVTARLTNEGYSFAIEDEPARSINDDTLIIVVP